jgi:4-hydroxy-tetrahydrodipicolinate reductase
MSVGVNLVLELLDTLTRKLPEDFDIEITEAHHRHKKDAPSGTALMLAAMIAAAKKWDLKKVLKYRTDGKTPERSNDEIGMQVIRAGEIIGDHTVLFAGPSETIEITHRAQSRDTFARGALLAANFLSKKENGFYSMSDVLK